MTTFLEQPANAPGPESQLSSTIATIRDRIVNYRGAGINEQDTKAALIDPVLRALGWDLEDLDEVKREYRHTSKDNPVDYALLVLGRPRLFIEAKPLDENLGDRRWINQIMGYAAVAGVDWVILTNGDEYQIYNAHSPVPVEEKRFRSVRISKDSDDSEVVETLNLLTVSHVQQGQLEALWRAQSVDQKVRDAIERLFSPAADKSLINLLRKRLPELSTDDIGDALRRIKVHLDGSLEQKVGTNQLTNGPTSVMRGAQKGRKHDVTLTDLIRSGLVHTPLTLRKSYKGHVLYARVESDGRVHYDGKAYDSLSVAGGMARRSIIGGEKYPATNGWEFWQFQGSDGKWETMGVLRDRYVSNGGRGQWV